MSIIIRLQNLPWEANSQDIRRFFLNLSIPEGGVHIVGGDKGDAFIAFSSDEDARQAMARDNQEIKGIKIRLFLSSRSEMAKTVEQARQAHLALMSKAAVPAVVALKPEDPNLRMTTVKVDERKRSRSRSRERRRSRSRERKRDRSRDRKRSRSRSRSRNRNRRSSRRSRSRSRSKERRDRLARKPTTKDGELSNGSTAELGESDTPVWEPGMQPGVVAALPTAANPFVGFPMGVTAGLTQILHSMHPGLPVNPLAIAALAQSTALQDHPVLSKPPEILNAVTANIPALKVPPLPNIAGMEAPLLPTPETPARKASPPTPSSLPVFPVFKNPITPNSNGVDYGLVFRISGLSELPNFNDVKHFFLGVNLPTGALKILWDGQFPTLLLAVKDAHDRTLVSSLHGEMLGRSRLKIEACDKSEFQKGEDFYVGTTRQSESLRFNRMGRGLILGGRAKPVDQDLVIVITGAPSDVSEADVRIFFGGLHLIEVFITTNANNQQMSAASSPYCFAVLASQKDLELALRFCGQRIRQNVVEVLVANRSIFDEMKSRYGKKKPSTRGEKKVSRFSNADDPVVPVVTTGSNNSNSTPSTELDPNKTVLLIEGLPYDIVDRQIGEMCLGSGVNCRSIHIKHGNNPSQTSCAFVECNTAQDAATVASINGRDFYGFKLKVQTVTPLFMHNMMRISSVTPQFAMPPARPGFEGPMGGPGGPFRPRGRGGARPGIRHPMLPNGMPNRFSMGRNGGMPMMKPNLPEPPILSPADPFANSRCVVAICNLNYSAGVDDLINVFKDYNIRKDLIMRRYNEQNQPTGDARVAFATPQEASEAVQRFNGTLLLGRALRLSLLG